MAETDWLIEAKTAYERGNATAATAAALIDIANTLRIEKEPIPPEPRGKKGTAKER